MISQREVIETVKMIRDENLDIRTVTMGISLEDCAAADMKTACVRIYEKICRYAERLVKTGEDIEREYGIPIVNKRIAVTPISLVGAACREENDYVEMAVT